MIRNIFRSVILSLVCIILVIGSSCSCFQQAAQVPKAIDPTSYITPNDSAVQAILPTIIAQKAFWRSDFGAIQVWVSSNITYTSDIDDYWQKPSETLTRRKGDCEDFAILLCTLLRAYEIPAEDVYVAMGTDGEGNGHAFVLEKWYTGDWRVIEPQDGGVFTSGLSGWITGKMFTIESQFNDVSYEGEPLWINQLFAHPEPTTAVITTSTPALIYPSVSSYLFSPNSIIQGNTVTASITLSRGSAGDYSLRLLQDISLASDQVISTYSISHSGSTTNKIFSFTPSTAGSYHMDIQYNGKTLWSQPNDSSRLVVSNLAAPSTTSVNFNGWFVNGNIVTTTLKNGSVTARLTLTSGSSGSYTMRVRRDVSMGNDETTQQLSFSYDGTSSTQSIIFTPLYVTGESGTSGYHCDLLFGSTTIWTMTDAYPPRLTVSGLTTTTTTTTTTAPGITSVNFNGWFVNGSSVTTTLKTSSVTATLTLTGGNSGTYIVRVRRDVSLGTDDTVQQLSFSYNGMSSIQSIVFTPPYSTGESGTSGYHVDLLIGSTTVWTMTDAYPPRLKVNPVTSTTLTITGYSFTPSTIKLGSSSTITFIITGGSTGTYTLNFWKDIAFSPDQNVGSKSFQHNGSSTTVTMQFTPTTTGTFHLDLSLNAQTLWSQPNDSTRLKVS